MNDASAFIVPREEKGGGFEIIGADHRFVIAISPTWRDYTKREEPLGIDASRNFFAELTGGGLRDITDFSKQPKEVDEWFGGVFILDLKDKAALNKVRHWTDNKHNGQGSIEKPDRFGIEVPAGHTCFLVEDRVGAKLNWPPDMRLDSKPLTELDKKFEDTTFARKYVESVGSKASARFDRIKKRAKWEFELD